MRLFRLIILSFLAYQCPGRGAALLVNGDFEGTTVNTLLNDSGFAPIFVELPSGWATNTDFRVSGKGWTGEVKNLNTPPPSGLDFPFDRDPTDDFLVMSSPAGHRQAVGQDVAWSTVSLYQEFTTTPGVSYVVAYDLAGSHTANDVDPNSLMGVSVDNVLGLGSLQNIARETDSWNQAAQGWEFQRYEHIFVATGTKTRLTLTDLTTWNTNAPRAALIDNVAVDFIPTIPEPSTVSTLMLGLLLLNRRKR
jgi:hypothetical protein